MRDRTTPSGGDSAAVVAVVTGASRGLGAGLASVFAAEGMGLGLCARTRPVAPLGSRAVVAALDVTDAGAMDAFAAAVVDRLGRIDLWVNNAGILGPIGPLADADPASLRRTVDVNVLGVLHGSATFARHVRSRPGGGVLVNMSSGAATRPYEGWAAYCRVQGRGGHGHRGRRPRGAGLRPAGLCVVTRSGGHRHAGADPVHPGRALPPVERFRRAHREGEFNSAQWVARYILDELMPVRPRRASRVAEPVPCGGGSPRSPGAVGEADPGHAPGSGGSCRPAGSR